LLRAGIAKQKVGLRMERAADAVILGKDSVTTVLENTAESQAGGKSRCDFRPVADVV
jgi:hypothetical protein